MALKDQVGQTYSSPDNKTAGNGVDVTLHTPNGPKPGKMIDGIVVPSTKGN